MEKFLCFDLRTGILAYGAINLIYSFLAACIHFGLSVNDDDPESAADQTFFLAGNLINACVIGSMTYGAYRESRVFLLPYLIFGCVAYTIVTLVCVVYMFYAPVLIAILIVLAFFWYVWYAVLCLYQFLDPHNPNRMSQIPATVVYVEDAKPPAYYANNGADAV